VQQGQKNGNRFLLVPADIKGDRQFINITEAEHFFQFKGNNGQGITVIALSGIQNSWDSTDIAEVQFIISVFGTSSSKDNGIFGELLSHFGKIVSSFLTTVTSCHNDKSFNGTGFNRSNNFIRESQYLMMGKSTDNFSGFQLQRCLAVFSKGNDLWKIFGRTGYWVWNLYGTGIGNHTSCKNPVQIGIFIFYGDNAVGGHEDGSIERLKIFILMPPGTTIIPLEMRIFFKGGVIIGRQHFTMSIDIHSGPFGLL